MPSSLYPVFRDEAELPANADLSGPIRAALENSDTLIVLCSPRACESWFVSEEIRHFNELGKADRILALILDGEPNAVDPGKAARGVTPAMECLPEPLRSGVESSFECPDNDSSAGESLSSIDRSAPAEAIAADVRPHNRCEQGFTNAAAYNASLEK